MNSWIWDMNAGQAVGHQQMTPPGSPPPPGTSAHATEIRRLEQRIDRLTLVCQSLWILLKEATELSDEQLAATVTKVDLLDGEEDGRYRKPITKCSHCDAMISHKYGRCLFCGEPASYSNPFDTV